MVPLYVLLLGGNRAPEQKRGPAPTRHSNRGDGPRPDSLQSGADEGSTSSTSRRWTLRSVPKRWIGLEALAEIAHWSISKFSFRLKTKVYVFSEAVLCLGGKCPEHGDVWEQQQISDFVASSTTSSTSQFKWRIYPGHTTVQILAKIQKMFESENMHPSRSKGRIIFMSMYYDIDWDHNRNEDVCEQNSTCVASHVKLFPQGRWSFLGPGDEEKWCERLSYKPGVKFNATAEDMMKNTRLLRPWTWSGGGSTFFREVSHGCSSRKVVVVRWFLVSFQCFYLCPARVLERSQRLNKSTWGAMFFQKNRFVHFSSACTAAEHRAPQQDWSRDDFPSLRSEYGRWFFQHCGTSIVMEVMAATVDHSLRECLVQEISEENDWMHSGFNLRCGPSSWFDRRKKIIIWKNVAPIWWTRLSRCLGLANNKQRCRTAAQKLRFYHRGSWSESARIPTLTVGCSRWLSWKPSFSNVLRRPPPVSKKSVTSRRAHHWAKMEKTLSCPFILFQEALGPLVTVACGCKSKLTRDTYFRVVMERRKGENLLLSAIALRPMRHNSAGVHMC